MENLQFTPETLHSLYDELADLRNHLLELEKDYRKEIGRVPPEYRESAINLIHYLGLRRHDIRPLQMKLSYFGLSSLGRLEAHVLAGIESVMFALERMTDEVLGPEIKRPKALNFVEGDRKLIQHTHELLGPHDPDRMVRIMVTMPTEAGDDYELVRDLMQAGMEIMRINSGHDDPQVWQNMVMNARKAEKELSKSCRILFDLGGPKLRTGAVEPGPAVVRINPKRDKRGIVTDPAFIWFGSVTPPELRFPSCTHIPVEEDFANTMREGDIISFQDVPGKARKLKIEETAPGGGWSTSKRITFLETGLRLHLERDGKDIISTRVGPLPLKENFLWLSPGDTLILTSKDKPGKPAQKGSEGEIREPARISCSLPSVFKDVKPGDPILFNDGKIEGVVQEASPHELKVSIKRSKPGGSKLRSDKGINLPKTSFTLPALSDQDIINLDFAAENVDMVGLSFVRKPSDLFKLQNELEKRGRKDMGVILKIENQVAFQNLPRLLLAGLREPPFGVMVARGDLGVEIGFDRLAEVQEEILWLCEAGHIPVIWATQVLESLAKKGLPSRAEVTDAAMSGRAECVMLNKGPHVIQTVRFLDKVLKSMRNHYYKKTPMLRKLKVSEGRFSSE